MSKNMLRGLVGSSAVPTSRWRRRPDRGRKRPPGSGPSMPPCRSRFRCKRSAASRSWKFEIDSGRELITVVELLSPTNKRGGADREQYVAKREELVKSAAHFVEIDLLRGGRPMPVERRPRCDYSVLVSRAEARPWAGFWPVRLRQRLPIIPVPLLPGDPDARIDLQEILHHVYDATGYEDFIYAGQPDPPLSSKDAAWAGTFVPS